MGVASSMLTQYDIEEVQQYCNYLFSQEEIVALYRRFCQLDRDSKGYISAEEFLSIPEFSLNPVSQRILRIVDGLNFKDFVAFLSTFSPQASLQHKIELMFKVYGIDGNGRPSSMDLLEVLRSLTGTFMSEDQREKVLCQVLEESGYRRFLLNDFIKILSRPDLKMEVEIPVE